MKTSLKGEAEKRSCMRTSSAFRTQSYFPPWARSPGSIEVRLSTLSALGRHNDDRESRAPPWPPLGYSDGSTAAVIYQTSRKKAVAIEVRCGIELSPCSVACPSGTIYTSFWPYLLGASRWHLGGTSVGWPPVRLQVCRSDDQTTAAAAGMTSSISLLSMLPTAVRWRLVVEEHFAAP
ncbi:hypothetical protein THAOC_03524 [Thalassiosira oceanica]|uniref:Uncharacterized protein n=1 Tax=Thalassiosira oceanica TaxID=159749 RepID=K0T7P2_THAOC|nr:hypothetical protein THAOC_03524 [Thalassiosira oceanica]|eukprot:EJK74783.1 hypothetical protein THAOC_03524 [Thalassiosira oceanica]